MKQSIPFAVAAVVLCIAGAGIAGFWTERWSERKSQMLDDFTARMGTIPEVIGDWEGTDTDVDQKQVDASHCTAFVSRVYENKTTGKHVSVFAVSGTGRHLAHHTPEACYPASGFIMQGEPRGYVLSTESDGPGYEFITATFLKSNVTEQQYQRVFWTFSNDGTWLGPDSAKRTFGTKPAVYKIYLIAAEDDRKPFGESIIVDFAQEFMPVVNAVLFPPEKPVEEESGPAES